MSVKLIDSLAGYNAVNQVVPTKGLSVAERYGSNLDPIKQCLRTCEMQESRCLIPNEIFKELKMDSTFLDWRDNPPKYIESFANC